MSKTSKPPLLFDGKRYPSHKARAGKRTEAGADFLAERAAGDIAERLSVTSRQFAQAVDLFSLSRHMHQLLDQQANVAEISASEPDYRSADGNLDLGQNTTDLVTSVFGLHWLNDLPGAFVQINNALRPDGLFLATLPGDGTLTELRDSLMSAEIELTGGATMRVDPFGDVRQIGNLLQRAGFKLPVTDLDQVVVRYDTLFDLINDLRAMGATSLLASNKSPAHPGLFTLADSIYRQKHSDEDGRIRATFNIIHLSGWSEHESQQKPLKPGSADYRLDQFLKQGSDE